MKIYFNHISSLAVSHPRYFLLLYNCSFYIVGLLPGTSKKYYEWSFETMATPYIIVRMVSIDITIII